MHELFEHKADIGIRGIGKSKEDAFSEAAKAMLGIMIGLKSVAKKEKIEIETKADSLENLLVEFLNEILFKMDAEEMIFSEAKVREIKEVKGKFYLTAELLGEKKNKKHKFMTEVKAATYSQLKVVEEKGKFFAECIVDV